ncbi:MAG TPA: hypothetical protein VF778_03030, partial [Xanthobacteraceae bacterium]
NVPQGFGKNAAKQQKIEARKGVEAPRFLRAFAFPALPPGDLPPWQCSCFVLEWVMCLVSGQKAA